MVEVNFFGTFTITGPKGVLRGDSVRSKQVTMLLKYILSHKKADISADDLGTVLWGEGESDNPEGALKNLVYRLRKTLEQIGDESYITSNGGKYTWNRAIETRVDIEEFEKSYMKAESSGLSIKARAEFYIEALTLYKGEFLKSDSYEYWVVPICGYYRKMFFKCAFEVCDYLMQSRKFAEVDMLCAHAATIDPFEERIHLTKMEALISLGRYPEALAHYEYVTALFYREIGVKPSNEIRAMYKKIANQEQIQQTDLSFIRADLEEALVVARGAFFCDYEVFKNFYQIEARIVERTKESVFVSLFTLEATDEKGIKKAERIQAMEILKKALGESLRRGDVVSRYSEIQYVAMVTAARIENSGIITERVITRFAQLFTKKTVKISTVVSPIEPPGSGLGSF